MRVIIVTIILYGLFVLASELWHRYKFRQLKDYMIQTRRTNVDFEDPDFQRWWLAK